VGSTVKEEFESMNDSMNDAEESIKAFKKLIADIESQETKDMSEPLRRWAERRLVELEGEKDEDEQA
jgi:hypothetical protein